MTLVKEGKGIGITIHYDSEVDILSIKLGDKPGPFGQDTPDEDVVLFYDEEDHLTELEITNASKRVSNFSLEADEGMTVFPFMSPVELGDFARNLRKRLNKSQAELARDLGVHQSNISRAEQGNTKYISIMSEIVERLGGYKVCSQPLLRLEKSNP